ncbi:excinuclease ATPase subunit [Halomonas heilongjiangensis]|uniref:Excinuclease ATPase subunit n=1 Tax=Halomonas heilongjiangensis TaxID=1387883 RepID=A0A2N7TVW7_9GAMM|nr:excinuclease ATPase subunit [Halomonas heilongjiangensis]PMR72334.1 excinuclease ATPase subunit [Halomonas heilongjiangensis]PXX86862.1 excinuclease ATPase subunit [Halomonas heilongjiangensis]
MTRGLLSLTLLIGGLALAATAQARDTRHLLSIEEAMNTPAARERLDPEIRFVFADADHGEVVAEHGNYVTNKKTNAFNKSDEEACHWVMLSALLSLQERVRAEGGNAVINIESYYKRNAMASLTEYECHAGAVMAGVALRGDVVTLR